MDDLLDLNALDMVSTYPVQQSPSPDSKYRAMYGFDLFRETLPSTFTMAHIDPVTFDQQQQHQEEDQDHQQPEDG